MSEIINNDVQVAPVAEAVPHVEAVVETKPWFDSLPEELKSNKNITSLKGIEDLAKGYANQVSLIGKKVSELPIEELRKYIPIEGKPESAEGYVFADEMEANLKADFAKKAFEAGLTQSQAKILADKMVLEHRAAVEAEEKNMVQLKNAWVEELKSEFGAAYDKRIDLARRSFNSLADDNLKSLLESTGLHEHPSMIKLFSKIGKDFLEPDRVVKGEEDVRFGISPADAKAKVNAKLADPEFKKAYLSAIHPNHKAAVDEITNLYKLMG